jgi:hypothetical protein
MARRNASSSAFNCAGVSSVVLSERMDLAVSAFPSVVWRAASAFDSIAVGIAGVSFSPLLGIFAPQTAQNAPLLSDPQYGHVIAFTSLSQTAFTCQITIMMFQYSKIM